MSCRLLHLAVPTSANGVLSYASRLITTSQVRTSRRLLQQHQLLQLLGSNSQRHQYQ
jgi:hypothetical protein